MTTYRLRSPLKNFGRKVRSQNDEDGIIEAIFSDIPPRSRYFVEFGIGPNWLDTTYFGGLEGNCVLLREQGWSGLFMDSEIHPEEYDIKREHVSALNFNRLLRKYNVPQDVDIVSIDVDGQDFWLWMALDWRPTLVVIEYNPNSRTFEDSATITFDPGFRWDGTKYYGATFSALTKLAADKGYKLVYANGVNCFFVREDFIANPGDFNDEDLLVRADRHLPDEKLRPWLAV